MSEHELVSAILEMLDVSFDEFAAAFQATARGEIVRIEE